MVNWRGKEPLDELLHLLQVPEGDISADAGIAHHPHHALERIEAHAAHLRDAAMQRSNDLLHVAVEATESGCSPRAVADLLIHSCIALGEAHRWMELVANANFYRHRGDIAERVAGVIRSLASPPD